MKVMPRSIAPWISFSVVEAFTDGSARCQPPRPIAETITPVLPSCRTGTSPIERLQELSTRGGQLPNRGAGGQTGVRPRRRYDVNHPIITYEDTDTMPK